MNTALMFLLVTILVIGSVAIGIFLALWSFCHTKGGTINISIDINDESERSNRSL